MDEITKQEINGISNSVEHVATSINDLSRIFGPMTGEINDQIHQLNTNLVIMNVLLGILVLCTVTRMFFLWKMKRK